MGVKNLQCFTLALLAKWRWRVINEDGGLWLKIRKSRYEEGLDRSLSLVGGEGGSRSSIWWKDILGLGRFGSSFDWFAEGLRKKLGRGDRSKFWEEVWMGDRCLKELFPRLYSISV